MGELFEITGMKNIRNDSIAKRWANAIRIRVCFETNFQKSRKYKISRYKNLSNEVVGNYNIKKLFIEISTLGF